MRILLLSGKIAGRVAINALNGYYQTAVGGQMKKIEVWDLPVRLGHWLLVGSYIGVFLTSRNEWLLEYHTLFGYCALFIVLFRIFWGFEGNAYARFSQFVRRCKDVRAFVSKTVRRDMPRYLGHNPAVGWIILYMLTATLITALSGIVVYSGEESRGFFAGYFTYDAAVYARMLHEFFAYSMVGMIVIHISAALFHDFILRENIILAMIIGTKEDDESYHDRISHLGPHEGRSLLRLVVFILITVLGGFGLIFLPPEGKSNISALRPPKIKTAKGFVVDMKPNNAWKAECATSCHGAFHPILLPADSWRKIMGSLSKHFGEDAGLNEELKKEILDYLETSSAEHSTSEASLKILHSIPKGEAPLRITETPYWVEKHSDLTKEDYKKPSVMSKSNCKACHPGADLGSFEDRDIEVPE